MLYKLDLNKLEKPYLNAYVSQISSKCVQRFERSQTNKQKMCLTKIVNLNHEYRSQRPYLFKLHTGSSGNSPNKN